MKPPVFNKNWADDVKALYIHDIQEIWNPVLSPNIWNQYHNQLKIYMSLARGNKKLDILDVGCAQGTLAMKLAEEGHSVCAMDIRQSFLYYAQSRYEKGKISFICGNAMDVNPGQRFDLIFANQIIEHLVYPSDFIKRLTTWLKPAGRIVITTPNGLYIKNPFPSFSEIDPEKHKHLQFTADADGHFFAYLPLELVSIASGIGLVDVKVTHFESPWISGHMKIRYIHGRCLTQVLSFFEKGDSQCAGLNICTWFHCHFFC